jgi:5-methylcytosine-specific restriction endonuclease McrA
MKVLIANAKLLDTGEIAVPILIGAGLSACNTELTLPSDDIPPGGLINSTEPHRSSLTDPGNEPAYFLFRGKFVKVTDALHLSETEIKLEVTHAVLKHEKRYQQLQRNLDVYNSIERADNDRRERIPDDVRMFVWQRDQGKCVRCGNNERLEFDHIIPVVKGGSNTERNIQLLCERCNREKGSRL